MPGIYDMDQKLKFLATNPIAIKVANDKPGARKHLGSEHSLAQACDIDWSTFNSAQGTYNTDSRIGKLSEVLEGKIAQTFRFDHLSPSWNDHSGRQGEARKDTAAAFQDYYLKLHKAVGSGGVTNDTPPAFDFSANPNPFSALAALGASGAIDPDTGRMNVSVDLNCSHDDLGQDVTFGIRKARLILKTSIGEVVEQLAFEGKLFFPPPDGNLEVEAFGLTNPLGWHVRSKTGLIGRFITNEPVCAIDLKGVANGARIEAMVQVYAGDLKPIRPERVLNTKAFSTAFLLTGEADPEVARAAVLERLAILPVCEGDLRTVCHIVKIVEDGRF